MKRVFSIKIFSFFQLAAMLFCFQHSFFFAQDTREYAGKYYLSGQLKGRAAYTYQTKNGEKIKEGPFLFRLDLEDSLNINYKEKYQLQGNYKGDQKINEWKFSYSSLYPEEGEYIDDLYIKETASGNIFTIKGDFKDGLANNIWTVTKRKVENSVVTDTNYFSSAEFKKGQFINNIQVQNNTHQLVGEIDNNSFLNGEWIIFHNDSSRIIIEYRIYNAGILNSHIIEIDGNKYTLNYEGIGNLNETDNLLSSIPVNDTYFEILKFGSLGSVDEKKVSLSTIDNIQRTTQELITGAFDSLSSLNGYKIWDGDTPFTLPKAKVKKHPFTIEEETVIRESAKMIQETDNYLNRFLHIAQAEISKNSNDTIAKYYEVCLHYEKAFIKIKTTFKELQKPSFEYVNRSLVIPKIFDGIDYSDKIIYGINDKNIEVSYSFPKPLKSNEATIISLFAQLKKIRDDIEIINAKVQPILKKEEQRAGLAQDEKKLVEKRDSIIAKFSKKSTLNEFQKKVSSEVVDYVQKEFKVYAQQPLDKRVKTLSSVLSCFDQFLKLYDQLEKTPKKVAEIKELYTRTVWNPFTMTDMDEIVKERVFNAYQNHILPYLIDQFKENIRCSNIENKTDNIQVLFDRMKELREQDTSELERQLKRISNPKELIEAFQLKLSK